MLWALQQCLPFTVLKRGIYLAHSLVPLHSCNSSYRLRYWNLLEKFLSMKGFKPVATVLTVYGIETCNCFSHDWPLFYRCNSAYRLQYWNPPRSAVTIMFVITCNSTYRLWYWDWLSSVLLSMERWSCNSTYCLRYWNTFAVSNCCNAPKFVVTEFTLYGMRQSVRDIWGAKWRWESHISSHWPNNSQRLYQFR